jgi:diguanylate cyclase (GGDEF)-like protein
MADKAQMRTLAASLDPLLLLIALCVTGAAALAAGAMWWRLHRRSSALARSLKAAHTEVGIVRAHDGIVSRPAWDQALDAAAQRCKREQGSFTVLFVNIDDFGAVNETLGHRRGDQILRELSRRLHRATPGKIAATRLGGDEYLLLLPQGLDPAQAMAKAVLQALSEPIAAGDNSLRLTASIGIASYPEHGSRARMVLNAGAAMRTVKQAGGNAWAVYDPKAAVDQQSEGALVADLRSAILKRQFELFYQPKIDAKTLQITAAEALLRWHHPAQGMISPAVFIPLAERHGLIGEIGNWVINEACRQAGLWRAAGLRMRVAINLSAFQMRQDDVVKRLQSALRANRLQPDRFTVEITESLALENTQATQRTFEGLREAGLHVAIDDFGAGQTSLAYLRQLPASELKMDMSLVRDLVASADARAIAEAVIKLAHALERRVVAEGVETVEQRDLLVHMGCDELQGFLFARPMSAKALGLWAMDDSPERAAVFSASLFKPTAVHA